jgi:hypothetical protein
MSRKHNNTGRRISGPPYAQLFHWIRLTEAWRSLSPYSRLLYVEIRGRFNGSNNGDISMSHREAMALLNCSNVPAITGFKELEDRGFIRPVLKGGFSWKTRADGKNRATTWRLTELPQNIPTSDLTPTYDFKTWVPTERPKRKTRCENLTPEVLETHTHDGGRALESHTHDVKISHPNGPADTGMGVKISHTLKLPYPPAPAGPVSQALLNTRIVRGKAAPQRGPTTQASAGGRS